MWQVVTSILTVASIFNNIINISFQISDELKKYYQECRALIFPGEEDFGIVPVEAMACGKPVIAFGKGGVRESVTEGLSGLFFNEQTQSSLTDALQRFSAFEYDPQKIRKSTERFRPEICKQKIADHINSLLKS